MIKITLDVGKDSDVKLQMDSKEVSVADLQAGICNLELIKMKLVGDLATLTDFFKGDDMEDEDEED
jgi:hypothetical protein